MAHSQGGVYSGASNSNPVLSNQDPNGVMPGPQGGHVPTRAYELMIIVDADADDAANTAVIDRVTELVEDGEGLVPTVDRWGRRRFAYEIDHKSEGVYTVLEISTDASDLHEVDRFLRLADDVVRHKLIRLPDTEALRRGLLAAD